MPDKLNKITNPKVPEWFKAKIGTILSDPKIESLIAIDPKLPKCFTNRALKSGDIILRSDGRVYTVYSVLDKLIYIHEPSIEKPFFFQLSIITVDQFLKEFKII